MQLKRLSAKKLRRTLANGKARNEQLSKRRAELVDDCSTMDASELRKGNRVQKKDPAFTTSERFSGKYSMTLFLLTINGLLSVGSSCTENTMQTPIFSSPNSNNAANSLTNPSNTAFPSNMISHTQIEPAYGFLAPQPYAPIFEDITITPSYDLVQASYAFSSTLDNPDYLASVQHGAHGMLANSNGRGPLD